MIRIITTSTIAENIGLTLPPVTMRNCLYLRLQTKLREDNVFTGVCLFTWDWGGGGE